MTQRQRNLPESVISGTCTTGEGMAGTTGLEPATSDVTGRTSERVLVRMSLFQKGLLGAMKGCFLLATVRATVRALRLLLWDFDFFIDQLHSLLTELREEVLVAFQLFALVAGVLCNDVVGHALS